MKYIDKKLEFNLTLDDTAYKLNQDELKDKVRLIVKQVKKELGIRTDAELAEILGITSVSVSRIKSGDASDIYLLTLASFIEGLQNEKLFERLRG